MTDYAIKILENERKRLEFNRKLYQEMLTNDTISKRLFSLQKAIKKLRE